MNFFVVILTYSLFWFKTTTANNSNVCISQPLRHGESKVLEREFASEYSIMDNGKSITMTMGYNHTFKKKLNQVSVHKKLKNIDFFFNFSEKKIQKFIRLQRKPLFDKR